jgi:nicotinamidase-related amidase
MMIEREHSSLWVIDVQPTLLTHTHDWQRVLDACIWLVDLAKTLRIPVVASEQYPQGLGATQIDLADALAQLPATPILAKRAFSCLADDAFTATVGASGDTQQVILCGIEAHVCVLQTALDLRAKGRNVFVVMDAISARDPDNITLATERLRRAGVHIVSREMVAFEWLRTAAAPEFKDISRRFLR